MNIRKRKEEVDLQAALRNEIEEQITTRLNSAVNAFTEVMGKRSLRIEKMNRTLSVGLLVAYGLSIFALIFSTR